MNFTKKSLKETMENEDFHSWRYLGYEKSEYSNRVDSRDIGVENVLADIKSIKGKVRIYWDYFTPATFRERQIREGKIEWEKSPVDYGYKAVSDCKSHDCQDKYWPLGCGYNNVASMEMLKNPTLNYFWRHDQKRDKTYDFDKNYDGYEVIYLPDNYVFQIGVDKRWGCILDFDLKFTESGWLRYPLANKDKIVKQLEEWGFTLKI